MSLILKNIRVGRPLLGAKVLLGGKLVLLVDTQDSCTIRTIDIESQKLIGGFKVALPPKRRSDFVATKNGVLVNNYLEKQLDLYRIETHKLAISYDVSSYHINITSIDYSEEKELFAVGDDQGNCTIWSIKDASIKANVKNLGHKITKVVFNVGANYVAVALENSSIVVFEIANPDNRVSLNAHKSLVTSMLFTKKLFFTADIDGNLLVWSAENLAFFKRHKLNFGAISALVDSFDESAVLFTTKNGRLMLLKYDNYAAEPLLVDVLGESLCGVLFENSTKRAMLYTDAGNLLFYNLSNDEAITNYFLQKKSMLDEAPVGSAVKVIVVDDSVTMRRVITAAIRNSVDGVELFEAKDGKEALKLLEENPDTDIMFLDWNMPTMNGEEVVAYIRSKNAYEKMQIVMATTEGGREKVAKMLRMGVAGYLVKPFRQDAIAKITQKLLETINKG